MRRRSSIDLSEFGPFCCSACSAMHSACIRKEILCCRLSASLSSEGFFGNPEHLCVRFRGPPYRTRAAHRVSAARVGASGPLIPCLLRRSFPPRFPRRVKSYSVRLGLSLSEGVLPLSPIRGLALARSLRRSRTTTSSDREPMGSVLLHSSSPLRDISFMVTATVAGLRKSGLQLSRSTTSMAWAASILDL